MCRRGDVAAGREAIVGGAVDTELPSARYPAVVFVQRLLVDPSVVGQARCSGVLVTPSHVLMAAHCARGWRPENITVYFGANLRPETLPDGTLGNVPADPRDSRLVAACAVHPTWGSCGTLPAPAIFTADSDHDLAVLTLNQPVPPSWASGTHVYQADFHRLVEPGDEPAAGWTGAALDLVGYGGISPGRGIDDANNQIRRFVGLPIAGLTFPPRPPGADDYSPWGKSMLVMEGAHLDADSPPAGYRGSARGDSGGPAVAFGAPVRPFRAQPVVGVATGQNFYTSLLVAENLEWLRAQLDLDDDGRWDTFCSSPFSAGNPGFDPGADPTVDPDGDGIRDLAGDNCPGVYNPCQEDTDGDRVGDACDTCDANYNPGVEQHRDEDMDGVIDACDNCPVPNPGQEDNAEFELGFASDGVGDACDNCPERPNPDQANCNVDAESVVLDPSDGLPIFNVRLGKFGVGDACDFRECGETRLESRAVSAGPLHAQTMDQVRVDARRAFVPFGPVQARTGFRFCRCPLATDDTLDVRSDCAAVFRCTIADVDAYRDPIFLGTEAERWRFVTLQHATPTVPAGPDFRAREAILRYGEPGTLFDVDLAARWLRNDDRIRWRSLGFDPDVRGDLPGELWTHTPGTRHADFPEGQRALTSHYWSGVVAQGRVVDDRFGLEGVVPLAELGVRVDPCPTCLSALPAVWLMKDGDRPVLRFEEGAADADFYFAPGSEGAFAALPAAKWLVASEPDHWLPEGGPRYAALRLDATATEAVLFASEAGFGPEGQVPPGPGEPPQEPIPPPLLAAAAAAPSTGPQPRTGHAAVLSARDRVVWVVGGRSAGGVEERDVWRQSLTTGLWARLPLDDVRPATVLAATYSPVDDSLWVLDVHRRHWGRPRVRLLRIAARGEAAEVVASWPRIARNTRHAMAVDPSGALYIAASGSDRGPHVVVRLARDDTGRMGLDRFAVGAGVLASDAARANARGVTILVSHGGGEAVPAGVGSEELRPVGPGVGARCF